MARLPLKERRVGEVSSFQHGRLSMDAIYRMDFTAKMNVAAICAAMAFVGAIVIGVF
jgi:hypothetical protein